MSLNKEDLTNKLLELSLQLGIDIEPAATNAEIEKQIAELEAKIQAKQGDGGSGGELSFTEKKDEIIKTEKSLGDFSSVQAVRTVWTKFQGKDYRLTGGAKDVWPKALAEQEQDAGFVKII